MAAEPRLSVVVVSYQGERVIEPTLTALRAQLGSQDELIVVDNASTDGTLAIVERTAPRASAIRSASNEGFAAGANRGAAAASGELLLFLNQDAVPAEGFCDAIRLPWSEQPSWAAWMGLITCDGGSRINSAGTAVHFTGISWAGASRKPVSEAPSQPREVTAVSGACFAIRRELWEQMGGFASYYFMYFEDTDLSLRLRLAGHDLGIEPRARVEHDYEFDKGPEKWMLLERNRWFTIVRTYPGAPLCLVMPALLVLELTLLLVSLAQGWMLQKLKANIAAMRSLTRLRRSRQQIQGIRSVPASQFAKSLSSTVHSEHLPALTLSGPVKLAQRCYWTIVLALLRLARGDRQ